MTHNPLDFSPRLLRLQETGPNPMGRKVLWTLLILLALLLVWVFVGRLDIVAVAEGKLVPQSYLKIVQPSEAGIVKEILVREGDAVRAGQVLMRMDAVIAEADYRSLKTELDRKRLSLRRIDGELSGRPFKPRSQDTSSLAREIEAQYLANRAALEAALAEERSRLIKAKHELAAAEQMRTKLAEILPHYQKQKKAFMTLLEEGFVAPNEASEKNRECIEKEQELRIQESVIESAKASVQQYQKKIEQIQSDYSRQLHMERAEDQGQVDKLLQEIAKQNHRRELMELKAPQDGIVKDIATHTSGTVAQPGTVLITLVPNEEPLRAEVWVSNEDIGFVREGQQVKLKFAAYPFQKYGMVEGTVEYISADATTSDGNSSPSAVYRALVGLKSMNLQMSGKKFPLAVGMQANAEIRLGDRSVLEYLLSPVSKAWYEAARER